MKLIDLTCPKCGASIKADPSKETYTCEYCESVLFIDKETGKANENSHGPKEEKPKTVEPVKEKTETKAKKAPANKSRKAGSNK